ncbi:tRNA pseudouridine synthase B [Camellia lanceoleosa]|uniref:tRNA pseudouridine synthase B n=1 Tax=Camellia lanceoleosa TaxID=1840588 RepID=A0ACC0HQA0_9ERIC|nr:tRNA pseudouridine synthase B [Camellia lanceoleosa]
MFFINVDRSSNNPRFEAQTHRTQPQQFALAVLHQSQQSLFFIDLEANRVKTQHQMVQTPISSFITASTVDLMPSSLVIQREPWEHIKDDDIKKTTASFCGEIWQVPLTFSAIKVTCSKETYIRSLCADLGKALNSCAHLIALRRDSIGKAVSLHLSF